MKKGGFFVKPALESQIPNPKSRIRSERPPEREAGITAGARRAKELFPLSAEPGSTLSDSVIGTHGIQKMSDKAETVKCGSFRAEHRFMFFSEPTLGLSLLTGAISLTCIVLGVVAIVKAR